MKNVALLMTLIALCSGCDAEIFTEDAAITYKFIVQNKTNETISVSAVSENDQSGKVVTIASGDSENICTFGTIGTVSNKRPLEELSKDDHYIGQSVRHTFSMAIGDEMVSDDIWLHKYWAFKSTLNTKTYTLIVTDGLLASLPSVEPVR